MDFGKIFSRESDSTDSVVRYKSINFHHLSNFIINQLSSLLNFDHQSTLIVNQLFNFSSPLSRLLRLLVLFLKTLSCLSLSQSSLSLMFQLLIYYCICNTLNIIINITDIIFCFDIIFYNIAH